jgi:hypothetical protein
MTRHNSRIRCHRLVEKSMHPLPSWASQQQQQQQQQQQHHHQVEPVSSTSLDVPSFDLPTPMTTTTTTTTTTAPHQPQSAPSILSSQYHPYQYHRHNHNPFLMATSSIPLGVIAPGASGGGGMASFLHFLLVFTMGGLFFTTALAGVTACYGMGMNNVRRALSILKIVWESVWDTFLLGLKATRQTLLGYNEDDYDYEEHENDDYDDPRGVVGGGRKQPPSNALFSNTTTTSTTPTTTPRKVNHKKPVASWHWKPAWQVLKEQLAVTKQTAVEGVQALRQEVHLYAAAVGPPGLIPLQYMMDRFMPKSLATMLEDSIKSALAEFPKTTKSKTIPKITLSSFSAGDRAPMLQAARAYEVDNVIALDCDMKWDSQIEATVQIYTAGGLARVPVSIKNVQLEGTVRIILTPLIKDSPGYGATLISLPNLPKINLTVNVLGGEVTKLPFLQREITQVLQKAIADQLLWPRRMVWPSMCKLNPKLTILSRKELLVLERTDPLLQAEQALAEQTEVLKKTTTLVHHHHHSHPEGRRPIVKVVESNDEEQRHRHIHNNDKMIRVEKEDGTTTKVVKMNNATNTSVATSSSSSSFLDQVHTAQSSPPSLNHHDNNNNNTTEVVVRRGRVWDRLLQWGYL